MEAEIVRMEVTYKCRDMEGSDELGKSLAVFQRFGQANTK